MGVVILVMIVLTALCYLGIVTFGSITRTDNSGEVIMETTTMNFSMPVAIFMFVLSIVSIREDMRLGIQNGAGRGTVFLANTACMLVTSVVLNLAFFIVTAVWNQFDTGVYIVDFFGALYTGEPFFESLDDLAISSVVLLALSVFLAALGTFTSLMYWRLNKLGKWVVSIGIGAAVILFVDVIIRYEVVAKALGRFLDWMIQTPWNTALCLVVLAVVFYAFARLLVRRNSITAATV
ncbi:MAG TPA: hypothetical protein IAD33_00490 [Candidatus Scatomorpha gallistercoris]|nr:hypothetical protein [Candidatus Scatomorpha gallistercoris]